MHPSGKDVFPPGDVESEFSEMETAPSNSTSDTTGTAVRVMNIDVVYYHQEDVLLEVN